MSPAETTPSQAAPAPSVAPALKLSWHAPSDCPSAAQLRVQVHHYLSGSTQTALRVDAQVTPGLTGYRLEMVIASDHGAATTLLEHVDCAALAEAAALKIALALEPLGFFEEPVLECPVAPVSACPAEPELEPEPEPEPVQRQIALRLAAGLDWGTLPGIGPSFEGGIALIRWPRVYLLATGAYWTGREFWRLDDPSVGGQLSAAGGGLQACPVLHAAGLEFPLCVGIEASRVFARGLGGQRGATTRFTRVAVSLNPQVSWNPHNRLGLWLGLGLAVPLLNYTLEVGPPTTVYRAKPLSARVAAGLEVRFGRG